MAQRPRLGRLRAAVLWLIFAVAAPPAAAQVTTFELDALRAQQEALQRRAIDQDIQLQALEVRLQADRATAATELRTGALRLSEPPYPSLAAPTAALAYPSISDAVLAESNRRVREAAKSRR